MKTIIRLISVLVLLSACDRPKVSHSSSDSTERSALSDTNPGPSEVIDGKGIPQCAIDEINTLLANGANFDVGRTGGDKGFNLGGVNTGGGFNLSGYSFKFSGMQVGGGQLQGSLDQGCMQEVVGWIHEEVALEQKRQIEAEKKRLAAEEAARAQQLRDQQARVAQAMGFIGLLGTVGPNGGPLLGSIVAGCGGNAGKIGLAILAYFKDNPVLCQEACEDAKQYLVWYTDIMIDGLFSKNCYAACLTGKL